MDTPGPTPEQDLASTARAMQATDDPLETMRSAVELAVRQIDGAAAATLSVVHRRGRVETPAASEPGARAADELQYELGEGPCLRAISEDLVVRLEAALDSRTVIGQATGILMERFALDDQQAYALLTRLSSHGNRKLRDLAQEFTTTGTIDGLGT